MTARRASSKSPTPRVPTRLRTELVDRLAAWFATHRRDLPWRSTDDAYAVWVSEIMLQQTTVAAVQPYYRRFLQRFPTVADLAAAELSDVLGHWAGLGYYSRARNLHAASKAITTHFGGVLPSSVAELRTLPGVGRYTAGAVASFAYNRPTAVVDTNVARVLARLFCVSGDPKTPAAANTLWALAERLVAAAAEPRIHNSALMELGSLVCTPREPKCPLCPVREQCRAARRGSPERWPELPPRRQLVQVAAVAVAVRQGQKILLAQRRVGDLWAGLWECPRAELLPGETADAAAVRAARELLGLTVAVTGSLPTIRHGVTFRAIRLEPRTAVLLSGQAPLGPSSAYAEHRWATLAEAAELPASSPQKRLLRLLQA